MTDQLRICFIGDSFVLGLGDPSYQGWVGRVLAAAGPGLTAFNLGVRRNTSADVLARVWAEYDARHVPGADHRLVVSFGSNDTVVEDGAPRVAPARTLEHLTALLTEAARRAVPVLVVGPPPVAFLGTEHLSRLLALADAEAALCADFGVPFVPLTEALAADLAWNAEALAGDGAHPAAGGYARAAEVVLAGGLLSWLTAPQAAPRARQ
ncbi:GDSL-type esterase/lipase family protein [Kitasatospora sp. NPDC096147]|uniref:GDSL-type esterase/lipase family protein n=1 Tax=Kitasatospora sp. NPDC096147 TaxID=3364093 RepID=UPI0037F81AA1